MFKKPEPEHQKNTGNEVERDHHRWGGARKAGKEQREMGLRVLVFCDKHRKYYLTYKLYTIITLIKISN